VGELDELPRDELVVVVVLGQHRSPHLFCQFYLVFDVVLGVRTGIDLVVVLKTGEFDTVPLFVELDHLTPQNYRVLFLLFLLDLRINLIIFHALHGAETDLDVAG
jgi:hypothetical protein